MIGERKLAAIPWGETSVLVGLWLAFVVFVGARLLIGPTAEALGYGSSFTDIGNAFEKAGTVGRYADLRLVRAVAGNALPEPPRIIGDIVTARIAWIYAVVATLLFAGVAVVSSGKSPRQFAKAIGLDRFDIDRIWVPGLAVAVVYLGVGFYARAMDSFGPDWLQTGTGGGLEVTLRDSWALVLYGATTMIAAPFGEELFYRGLVFTGLSQWGFVPAALVSSLLFAFSHVDVATVLPFTVVGLTMCWLFWRSGSIWDAVVFHVLFNSLSFILLLART